MNSSLLSGLKTRGCSLDVFRPGDKTLTCDASVLNSAFKNEPLEAVRISLSLYI